ncbi:uncharacterized protein LOC18008801 [Eutrema salsugineum]|nr:uncharacterized protein LOC18008801 [Eutrema salsugineum]
MTEKAPPLCVVFIVALLLLSPLFLGQLEAISTKQAKHRKMGNRGEEENRINGIVIQIKAKVKRSYSKKGPQKKEPYKRVPPKKPPCKPPTHPH